MRDLTFVSQIERRVEHFALRPDGSWHLRESRDDDEMPIDTLCGALRLAALYLKVFDA